MYDQKKTYLVFEEFGFGLQVNNYLFDPQSFYFEISIMLNDLIQALSEKQTRSYSLEKVYSKEMAKVIFEFDIYSKLISQTRHMFSYMEYNTFVID